MIKKILLISALMLSMISFSQAATFRYGEEVVVGPRERINTNLVVSGKKIHIYGIIRGDVIAAGEEIVIEGRVYGDIIAAGRVIRIQSRDVEDIRVAGQDIFISTYTGKDVFVAGQYVTLSGNNVVGSDAVIMGQNLKLGGVVAGNLKAHAESVQEDPGLLVRGEREIVVNKKHHMQFSRRMMAMAMAAAAGFKIYSLLILWGLLWLMLKFKPVFLMGVQKTMDTHVLKSVGVAFLFLILLPVAWVFLGISMVGIPLIFSSIAFVIFIGLIYHIQLALWLGQKIAALPFLNPKRSRKKSKGFQRSPHLLFWIGMISIFILQMIPVIGGLVLFFSYFWVLGALLLQVFDLSQVLRKKKLV